MHVYITYDASLPLGTHTVLMRILSESGQVERGVIVVSSCEKINDIASGCHGNERQTSTGTELTRIRTSRAVPRFVSSKEEQAALDQMTTNSPRRAKPISCAAP
jgi:hypothetical protein